jgi:predicted glutamine amidotransferase
VIISSEKIGDDKNWNEIKDNHLLAIDENINTTIYPLFE